MNSFPHWLVQQREKRGWSQHKLAVKIGFSQAAVSRVEAGTAPPTLKFINAVADAFGVPVDEVYRAAGQLPQVDKRTEYLRRIENKLARLPDDAIRERVERIIDLFVPDDKNDGKEKQ